MVKKHMASGDEKYVFSLKCEDDASFNDNFAFPGHRFITSNKEQSAQSFYYFKSICSKSPLQTTKLVEA
ncbi:MAG: hypothetical protein RJQ14_06550, partial [Marinoscillum sp.]